MKTNPADAMQEEYDFSQGKRGAVLPHQGKSRITIWIDTDILDWFRATAEHEGRGYQTAMNAALRQYTQQGERPLPDLVRDVIREELQTLRTVSDTTPPATDLT
ncbi:MAG TPA: BrnA antitoxin family protein [Candidatus Tectomicrobia bacterium]